MKKLLFFLLVLTAFTLVSCESASLKTEKNEFGVKVCTDSKDPESCYLCTYDKADTEEQSLTCSFTAKVNDMVYECDKLKLSSIDFKNFSLETSCKVILNLNVTTQNQQSTLNAVLLRDFKNSGKVCETQNFYAYNLNLIAGGSGVSNFENCGYAPSDWG